MEIYCTCPVEEFMASEDEVSCDNCGKFVDEAAYTRALEGISYGDID